MKKHLLYFALIALSASYAQSQTRLIDKAVESAAKQVDLMVRQMDSFSEIRSPRTIAKDGKSTHYTSLEDWTSGFFPGSLWYLYELTGDEKWKTSAVKYTEGMEHIKHYTGNHDIGFMIFCSFGNGLRLSGKESYKEVIVTAAQTLAKRYRPEAGIVQSWNKQRNWECPVIIDNMMNLELMFEATKMSGDSTFWNIAVNHADNTIKNHYRNDMSCWHVVDYDSNSYGIIRGKYTAQGYADNSTWARGQAWGLYGFTLCYRYTGEKRYLNQAEKIAKFLLNHPNLPKDKIPYWDYDVPNASQTKQPRDASAAAITASALYELSGYSKSNGKEYKKNADAIIRSLSSPDYASATGGNGNFILIHSTGSIPHNVEIDVPLVYADYYFLEALKRKRKLEL